MEAPWCNLAEVAVQTWSFGNRHKENHGIFNWEHACSTIAPLLPNCLKWEQTEAESSQLHGLVGKHHDGLVLQQVGRKPHNCKWVAK